MLAAAPCMSTPKADEDTDESADDPIHNVAQVPDLPARSFICMTSQGVSCHLSLSQCGYLVQCCCCSCWTHILCTRHWWHLTPMIGTMQWTAKWKICMLTMFMSWCHVHLGHIPFISAGSCTRNSRMAPLIKTKHVSLLKAITEGWGSIMMNCLPR